MDISSVDLSKLQLVSTRSGTARRSSRAQASDDASQKVNPTAPRLNENASKKLDAVGKVQQAFMFALRLGEDISRQGILEPIM
jgi:hypothetical protein